MWYSVQWLDEKQLDVPFTICIPTQSLQFVFLCFFNYFPTDGTVPLSKIPLQEKISSKQFRFVLSHQRGAERPPRFLLSHPEGLLRRVSSIKHWEITMLCTSSLLYCRPGWDLVRKWVLTHRKPPHFPEACGLYHCWRQHGGLNRPRLWPCLAIPMGGNWKTSQEARLCPKIYSQGCNVSNWMNAIKSAESFFSVVWYFYYFLCNCFTSNKNTLTRKYSGRYYPLLLVRRITHCFSTSQGMHEGTKHLAQTGSWLLGANSIYSIFIFHQLLLNFIASELHRFMW